MRPNWPTSSAAGRRRLARECQDGRGCGRAAQYRGLADSSTVGDADAPARALIFDSVYDAYRGVVTYVRMIDGELKHRDRILMMSTKSTHEALEVGVISPEPIASTALGVGEVGYLITGVRTSGSPASVTRSRWQATVLPPRLVGIGPEADGVLRALSA